jgi:hypothetical protein
MPKTQRFVARIQLVSAVQVRVDDPPPVHQNRGKGTYLKCPLDGHAHQHARDGSIAQPEDWVVTTSTGTSVAMTDAAFSEFFYPDSPGAVVGARPHTDPNGTPKAS